uniref:Uncharacterized protein n=1 Tax=mine drainage metagenome TaxID=410659 RepID=E6Q9J3_9ZZZZ
MAHALQSYRSHLRHCRMYSIVALPNYPCALLKLDVPNSKEWNFRTIGYGIRCHFASRAYPHDIANCRSGSWTPE